MTRSNTIKIESTDPYSDVLFLLAGEDRKLEPKEVDANNDGYLDYSGAVLGKLDQAGYASFEKWLLQNCVLCVGKLCGQRMNNFRQKAHG